MLNSSYIEIGPEDHAEFAVDASDLIYSDDVLKHENDGKLWSFELIIHELSDGSDISVAKEKTLLDHEL